jgi:hypothetical protein
MNATFKSRARLLPIAAAALGAVAGAALLPEAHASSHREAPGITERPKVDGTDFYMFSSYEPGSLNGRPHSEYVTILANYQPLQAPYGGPNYFSMDPDALYEIHIDNDGDNREDLTFQFKFKNTRKNTTLQIDNKTVAIPLIQAGQVSNPKDAALNVNETFTVDVVRGSRRQESKSAYQPVTNAANNSAVFDKPVDNIGTKTIPDYAGYAAKHIYQVNIPGCAVKGQLFVGQRKEAFAVNLGTIFDLVNAPVAFITDRANADKVANTIDDANITTMALEVHKSCLTKGNDPVIGGWTTASLRQGSLLFDRPNPVFKFPEDSGGPWTQVSRLGMPLVNEVVIGLPDKDKFNGSQPKNDGQFLDYVTNPTLPRLLEIALGTGTGTIAPTNFPRTDLMNVFLTGIAGVNRPANPSVGSEMLRLNTSTPPTPEGQQKTLGLAVGDAAGFPNGRRPKDDVVDISLVAVAGGLCVVNGDNDALKLNSSLGFTSACKASSVPLGATSLNLHDGVDQSKVPLLPTFPYLFTPTPGAGAGSN